ncbi:MAG: zinc-binding alcohol dehydrogenase [Capsulimonadaceae bacterium]|nr:zinc-binding alcohol dehydrogenase [Capsulimonadaceae bacterium]
MNTSNFNQGYAVVSTQPWKVSYQQVKLPAPTPDDVVVRVTHSWISNGTEGSCVRGERIGGDTPRRDSDPLPFPFVPGYQKVGVVEWTGEAVCHVSVGDFVFATVSRVDNMFFDSAGHVSPAIQDKSQVWKLPSGLDPVSASGLVLTQVGYNVGTRAGIVPGDQVVVLGDGMVGQWAAQTFQHRGARVLIAGRHDERLGLFKTRPGDRSLNTRNAALVDVVREWAPDGVKVVADTAGGMDSLVSLLPLMRHGGHIVSAGFYGTKGMIDIQTLRDRELTLHAPAGWNKQRMDETLALLAAGHLDTLSLITHRFPVSKAGDAFDLILNRRENVLGVILDWED